MVDKSIFSILESGKYLSNEPSSSYMGKLYGYIRSHKDKEWIMIFKEDNVWYTTKNPSVFPDNVVDTLYQMYKYAYNNIRNAEPEREDLINDIEKCVSICDLYNLFENLKYEIERDC